MDHRQAAQGRIDDLITLLSESARGPEFRAIVDECEALARAIAAFHMEGIRFRMFHVDRLLTRAQAPLPERAPALLAEARMHLEAAGFHTRSHQAPG